MKQKFCLFLAILMVYMFTGIKPVSAQLSLVRNIAFPVIGKVSYGDDFGDPRSGGRTHEGNDIMGAKLMPLIAVTDGTISYVNYPQPSWGYSVGIKDSDGYEYWYLHINNDNPGTDDGNGGGFFAYAPDIVRGSKVVKGQLIGWMGDSGNAEATQPHLHFEIHTPEGTPIDPYQSLKAALKFNTPTTDYPIQQNEIVPYDKFANGGYLTVANFDQDSDIELATSPRAGGGPLVRLFDNDGTALKSWYAYDQNFRGGSDIASADVDGDGREEIITSPGVGGGPHIKVFRSDGSLVSEFFAYPPSFHGGVNVSSADLDNDGKAEIITAPASGGGPHVRVFKPDGKLIHEFMAYSSNFSAGIDVAAVKYGTGQAAIVTSPNKGGGPHIKIFKKDGNLISEFMAYSANFYGGVRISAMASSSNTDQLVIAAVPASGGGPHVRVFSQTGLEQKAALTGFEEWWNGGYDIGASQGKYYIVSGPGRRVSVREAFKARTTSSDNFINGRQRGD